MAYPEDARPMNIPSEPEPPWEYTLHQQLQSFNTLLVAGGLLDQPYWLWTLMEVVNATINNLRYKEAKILEVNAGLANGKI